MHMHMYAPGRLRDDSEIDSVTVMTDVLIRNVGDADLELLRADAAARGVSLQSYLAETLETQAAHLRRQKALGRTAERLAGREEVPGADRTAVLDAIDSEHRHSSEGPIDRTDA